MSRLKSVVLWITLTTASAAIYGAIIFLSPLPISVIDRNSSGIVSMGEALNSTDIGQRPSKGRIGCIEYFWLKDGQPAYMKCQH